MVTGGYNDPVLCAICGVDYYNMYKTSCPMAYAVSPTFRAETVC